MVINLRGTGGSGKSTIVRTVMERFNTKTPYFVSNRKQPIAYHLHHEGRQTLWVLGHYETACGGCDTITSPDVVYQYVDTGVNAGCNVLYEGIIIGDDVTRCVQISKKTPLKVIALNTPIPECLQGIQSRRDERGDVRPLNPKNTISRNDRLKRIMVRLRDARVDAVWMNREQALATCLNLLGVE